MARETLYEVLQVRATAEAEVIEGAYKRLVGKYHPDKNRSPDATERLQELNEAFRILRDPALRAAYDEERQRHLKHERERREREQQEERKHGNGSASSRRNGNGSASVGSTNGPPNPSETRHAQVLPTRRLLRKRRTRQAPRRQPGRAQHPPPARPPHDDRRRPRARPPQTRSRTSGAGLFGRFSQLERTCSSHARAHPIIERRQGHRHWQTLLSNPPRSSPQRFPLRVLDYAPRPRSAS